MAGFHPYPMGRKYCGVCGVERTGGGIPGAAGVTTAREEGTEAIAVVEIAVVGPTPGATEVESRGGAGVVGLGSAEGVVGRMVDFGAGPGIAALAEGVTGVGVLGSMGWIAVGGAGIAVGGTGSGCCTCGNGSGCCTCTCGTGGGG